MYGYCMQTTIVICFLRAILHFAVVFADAELEDQVAVLDCHGVVVLGAERL